MKANISANLSVEQLKRALEVREQIEKLEQELSSILGNTASVSFSTVAAGRTFAAPAAPARKGKRVMSAEWRAKIAAAQTRRWAREHAQKAATLNASKPAIQTMAAPGKRVMSSETKAKIAAAARARHAKARAGK